MELEAIKAWVKYYGTDPRKFVVAWLTQTDPAEVAAALANADVGHRLIGAFSIQDDWARAQTFGIIGAICARHVEEAALKRLKEALDEG